MSLSPEEIEKLQSIKSTNKSRGQRDVSGKTATLPPRDSGVVDDVRAAVRERKEDDNCQYATSRVIADKTDHSPQKVALAMQVLEEMGEVEDRSDSRKSQWRILMTVSRDPSDYHPTTHAGQQAKDRGIEFSEAADTLEDGEVRTTHKPDCRLFIKEFEHYDRPVGVVANVNSGEIVTIEFRH